MGEDPEGTTRPRRRAVAVLCGVGLCAVLAIAGWAILRPSGEADEVGTEARVDADDELPALVLEPGDSLPNGFVVADGTSVPGGVFPEMGDRSAATFTSADVQIEVPGDMTAAVRDYLDQAVEVGYALIAHQEDDACWYQPLEVEQGAPQPAEPAFVRLHCSVSGTRSTPDGQEQFRLDAERTYPVAALQPVNALRIGFSASNVPPTSAWRSIAPAALPEPGSGPSTPEVPLDLPGSVDPLCGPAMELVEGSRILAVTTDCGRRSRVALAVTGDPDEVYSAYVEQVRAVDPQYSQPLEPSSFELSDVQGRFFEPGRFVHVDGVMWDDGSTLEVRMLDGDGVHAPTLWIDEVKG